MNSENSIKSPVIIIGAGPAGLTAAYDLVRRGVRCRIIERDTVVGGIARTAVYRGYRFDIGGHRFFTKVKRVMDRWREVLGDEFLLRPRLTHIYYRGKFFRYPVKPADVLTKLGFFESARCAFSYFAARLRPRRPEDSFEDYIINRFGERLYRHFFKSYTEKVWGVPAHTIKAEWAAQRIRGLSLSSALRAAIFGNRGNKIKSLIEKFYYPRLGPGQLWEKTLRILLDSGLCEIMFECEPVNIGHADGRIQSVTVRGPKGEEIFSCSAVFSSMPLGALTALLQPALNPDVLAAGGALKYRDFITVALIIRRPHLFDDTWLYIHEPKVRVGRIQNFKQWSPDLVPDPKMSCLGLEYFCNEGDELWRMADGDLVELAKRELSVLGLVGPEDVSDGAVVRVPKTYPVYDDAYEKAMPAIRAAIGTFQNLFPIGRNGMHKYNNQDHSMLTAMLAVENFLDGSGHDLWSVNTERVYHEEDNDSSSI